MFNLREIPAGRVLLPFMAGILLAIFFDYQIPGILWIFTSLGLCLILLNRFKGWYRYRTLFGIVFPLTLVVLGYNLTWQYNELHRPTHFIHLQLPQESIMVGKIAAAPVKKEDWVKIEFEANGSGTSPDSLLACTGNILLYIANDSAASQLAYGDMLAISGRLTPVEPPKNPHAFDYSRYLHFKNIHHQAFVREEDWKVLAHGFGNPFTATAIYFRDLFLETLRKHLHSENELSVGSALILGYRDEVPEEILTAYSQTGAIHVLAVSGLHVGIVFLILNFFLKRVRLNNTVWAIAKVLLMLLGIWSFALVTGASPSVIRATVMFSFVNVGLAFRRHTNVYNTLAISAFCLLLYNPYWLANVSFQLSYLAVLGIVYFQPKFQALWKVKNKFLLYLWQLVCVSLGAQLMTLPFTLFYFHQFPTYFWLSSLILVPLAGVVLGGGLLLFLLEAVAPGLAVPLGVGLYWLLWFCNESIFFIQNLPVAVITGIWIGAGVTVLLYLSLVFGMVTMSVKKARWLLAALSLLVIVSLSSAFTGLHRAGNRQLVVYHVYKQTAIDFFDGEKVYSIVSRDIGEKALKFAAEGHRFAMNTDMVEVFDLRDTTAHVAEHWFHKNGFIQFYDIKTAIVNTPVTAAGEEKISVDYVIVRGSPKMKMEDLAQVFDFKKIIFDASNKKWQVEKWVAACRELGWDCYDVAVEGAFVLDLPR